MSGPSRLVALYPKAWRERYGVEFEALLDEMGISPRLVADVFVAAVGARIAQVWHRPKRLPLGPRQGGDGVHPFGRSAGRGRIARVGLSLILAAAPVASGAVGYYLGSRDREADVPTSYPATESAFRTDSVGTFSTGTFTVFCLDRTTGMWVVLEKGSRRTCPAAPSPSWPGPSSQP